MNLAELLRTRRNTPEHTWNIASSEHWYNGDNFWLDMITQDEVYRGAMIDTEAKLIDKISDDVRGKKSHDIFVALGPGDSAKEAKLHAALGTRVYVPIDVNEDELTLAAKTVPGIVRPIHAEFREGLQRVKKEHPKFIYLGSTYSNLEAMGYDLLQAIDETMQPGDSAYVSVQTFPNIADIPLLTHQYHAMQYRNLGKRMAGEIGVEVKSHFVQFNPVTKNMELGITAATVNGPAKEVGIKPGDKIIYMISHKPETLAPEISARFGDTYEIKQYQAQHQVPTESRTYMSTFEGIIMTKK